MILVGFIKQVDYNISTAMDFADMLFHGRNEPEIIGKTLGYLSKGVFLTGVMSTIHDFEGKLIGDMNYFTDGKFIWPVYYPYYLERFPLFYLDQELLKFMQANDYKVPAVSKERLEKLEAFFAREWVAKKSPAIYPFRPESRPGC